MGGAKYLPGPRVRPAMAHRFVYTGIRVRDLDRSLRFYTKLLGMIEHRRGTAGNGGTYVGLRSPRSRVELELNYYPEGTRFETPYRPGEELDHLGFIVDDVASAYKALLAHGAKVGIAPKDSEGAEVYVKDPDGIWIELLE